MFYCTDCKKLVEEGERAEQFDYEYGSEKGVHTYYVDCCSECGSEDIEKPWKCVCGEDVPPGQTLCENCQDNLNTIKCEIRNLFPKIKPIDQTTVEEFLIKDLFARLTPMEFIDGGYEL